VFSLQDQSGLVRAHFDSISDYDTCDDYVVPWNEEIQETVYSKSLEYLGLAREAALAVDLGIGTAHGAQIFLSGEKSQRIVGIDFSEKMLGKARQNLSASGLLGRAELVNADFTEWSFPEEQFDVCFSAIAIHNATNECKRKLFKSVFESLKPGGFFVNGDFVQSESAVGQDAWRLFYQTHLRAHLNEKELEAWLHHAFVDDKPAKLQEQRAWLEEAGFSEFGVIWQKNNLAVYFTGKSA